MTCGAFRPTVFLPEDAPNWTEEDLHRAILHEVEHVKRGDWVIQCLSRVICAAYWFHPLVWLAWRRLILEAEGACDNAVLQHAEPAAYADQLLNLARRLSTSGKQPLLAMADRSQLAERIHAVLDGKRSRTRAGAPCVVGAFVVAALVVCSLSSFKIVAASQTTAKDSFEVISIRSESASGMFGGRGPTGELMVACSSQGRIDPGRLEMTATVYRLITLAYGKDCGAAMGSGLIKEVPDWIKTQMFVMQATIPTGIPAYTMSQLQSGEAPRLQAMLQNMLVGRFQLALHRGSKEGALYNLVVASPGKIKLSADQTPPVPPTSPAPRSWNQALAACPRGSLGINTNPAIGKIAVVGCSIQIKGLVKAIQAEQPDRLVIDKTGLEGLYDIPELPLDGVDDRLPIWPEILPHLGLKLESARSLVGSTDNRSRAEAN